MTAITEVAPNVFRISTFIPEINLQFNQFLVRDDEPLLFHTGPKRLFQPVREAVAAVLDPATIRWIGFSHFEADECGSLTEWQLLAPRATAVCSVLGKLVSVDDSAALRPARGMVDEEVLVTGRQRFRFLSTPHVPHGWDAGMLFEETDGTLFCSDLFHQNGDVEPRTEGDVVGRFRQTLEDYQRSPLADYLPWSTHTEVLLNRIAARRPRTLAAMHGSTYTGDGERAIRELGSVWRDVMAR